jgi:hypothetical protein
MSSFIVVYSTSTPSTSTKIGFGKTVRDQHGYMSLLSPNGTTWYISVDDSGNLVRSQNP